MAEPINKHTETQRQTRWYDRVRTTSGNVRTRTKSIVKRNPTLAFGALIIFFILLLSLGKILQPAPEEKTEPDITKAVKVYSIGEGPQATFQGQVEKTGVVQIVAQANGVVQFINKNEGDAISAGQQIVSLSTNYQGGNAQSVQRQIAQTQYQNVLDTHDKQKDLLNNQREVADKTKENADKQREIQKKSIDETKTLIDNNQSQIDSLDQTLRSLEETNQNGGNNNQTGQTGTGQTGENALNPQTIRGSITQLQGALNQLRSQQRTTEYESSDNEAPARLADLQKQVTQKQLDLQEKTLELNKEVSRLQVQLAYVNEAIMYPASPFTGVVEKVFVKKGQIVNPGTVIATVAANDIETTVTVLVPQNVAQALQQGEPSTIAIKNKKITATPYYVSKQATDGQLYSVYYDLPAENQQAVSDAAYVSVTVPIGTPDTGAVDPLIPIDAVYQSQTTTSVLVVNGGKAATKQVEVGEVYGDYVTVSKGLKSGDQIILNRNVIAGEKITIE